MENYHCKKNDEVLNIRLDETKVLMEALEDCLPCPQEAVSLYRDIFSSHQTGFQVSYHKERITIRQKLGVAQHKGYTTELIARTSFT